MSSAKNFDKLLNKELKKSPARSQALSLVVSELRRKGHLVSCILTDNNGLIIAEAVHPRDSKENLSALVALIDNASEKIDSYLNVGPVKLSFFITNNNLVFVKPIHLSSNDEQYNLLAIQKKNILQSLPKITLKLLGKQENNIVELMLIASKWISRICKD
ncbi:MAG: roadblock/LC7 domain-containing protein [Asgard group archaeon]|nr:roadblock/LC7 domain-containing protein [Asgard group archaeon]